MAIIPLVIKDEDVALTSTVSSINFTGPGVSATTDAVGNIQVEINGCGGGLVIQDEGLEVIQNPDVINFKGAGVTAVQTAPGVVSVTIPGAAGGGGDPGGVGGDPLGAAQFPIGTYAYSDTGTTTPSNVLEINDPLILDVLTYPELAQVAEIRNDFLRGITSDVENNPYMDGFDYDYSSTYRNKHYIVLFRNNTTGACRAAVWKVINRKFVFQTTIPLNDPPIAGQSPFQLYYNGEYLAAGYTGIVNRPAQPSDYGGRVVIYQGQGTTWVLRSVVDNPTPLNDYRTLTANAAIATSPEVIGTQFARTVAMHDTFFVVGTSNVRNEVSPGVFTIGRAYVFDYNGALLNTIISPRTNVISGSGFFQFYYGTFGEAVYAWGTTGVVFGTMSPPNYITQGGIGHGAIFYSYDNALAQTVPTRVLDMNDFGADGNLNNYAQRRGLASYNETEALGNLLYAGAPDQRAGQRSDVGAVIIINLATGVLFQTLLSPSVNSDSFGRVVDAQDDVVAVRASFTSAGYAFRLVSGLYQLVADFGAFAPKESFPDEFYIWADTDTFISETDFNLFSAYLAPKLVNEIAAVPLPESSGKKTILRVR